VLVLKVARGPDQGKQIELESGKTYTVGCDPSDSLRLSDPMVLKGHCAVEAGDGTVIVRNQTASAGTFIGEKKIAQARLRANTGFRVGDTTVAVLEAKPRPPAPKHSEPAEPDPLIGKIIKGYKLKEVVGEGGMGKVYRATQLSLHRDVALKVLRSALAKDKSFRDLFVNEARAAAQLVHPNVVQVYDAGREGEVTFFSMEFISQGSVEEVLERQGTIPWDQAILWVLEAAHGLDYAESKDIVHRDIKPDNLMINEDGRVKIADLGLAKRGESKKEQGIIGTPHFIPPEQALGKEVDNRADIYSLGATFFRMITGKTLFTGKSAKEIVLKHIKEPPPAASSVVKDVPDDLDLVLAKMLAKDPDQRHQNAKELIAALEEVCAHHGIKGSIIRKGVGKRVLIPLVLLVLAAGAVAYHFATQDPEKYVPPEVLEAQKRAEEQAKEDAAQRAAAERTARKANTEGEYRDIKLARADLKAESPLDSTYDEPEQATRLERKWLAVADRFREFAETDDAKEFGFAEQAEADATTIENGLRDAKQAQAKKREEIGKQVAKAETLAKKQRDKLADLRQERQFEEAANLCKVDPFKEVVDWVWVNPVNGNRQPATEIAKIMKVVEEGRKYFEREGRGVLAQAKRDWEGIEDEVKALSEDAPDEQISTLIGQLEEVQMRYLDPNAADRVPEIREYTKAAKRHEEELRKILTTRFATRLAEDRTLARNTQRKFASLDENQLPNFVMNCEFAAARNEWRRLLDTDQIKTDLYREFVEERIQMLLWTEYLFARFQLDLHTSETDRRNAPLRSTTVEIPLFDGRDRMLRTGLKVPGDDNYELNLQRSYKGDRTIRLARFPMDWIYHGLFHDEGEPRWEEVPPAIEFALGAFCFETMQYKQAKNHFDKLAGDERYGEAAKSLSARAAAEQAARTEWESLCQATLAAKTTDEIQAIRGRITEFEQKYRDRIFFLDVMAHNAPITDDFHDADHPAVPPPPPPPPRPAK